MSKEQPRESIIVADCGKGLTRATLLETIDGACRFVAQGSSPSSIEPPYDDLQIGVRAAFADLEERAARCFTEQTRLISPQEDTGDGTDAFLTTVAAALPLRVAVLSAGGGPLVEAVLMICRRAPVTALPALALDRTGRDDAERKAVAAIAPCHPNLLLLVAPSGMEAETPRLLELASEISAAAPDDASVPTILMIGEERTYELALTAFGKSHEFGFVPAPADSAGMPGLVAAVEQELLDLANRRAAATIPGFNELAGLGTSPLARARALELVNRFMALQFGCEVVTVDLEDGLTCCWARGAEHRALSEPALDLALGAANLLTGLSAADVLRWLPFGMGEDELRTWILNRALRPFTLPTTRKDRLIEAALAREVVRLAGTELGVGASELAPDLVVGGVFFARWPDPALAFLTLVDGVRPAPANGLTQVALDRDGLLPVIGALGTLDPGRAAELFEHDGLLDLGAHVAVECASGATARGRLEWADGRVQEFTVAEGTLVRLPLREGERAASLRIEQGGKTTVGRGKPGAGALFEGDIAPYGGPVGLVIDARGRALSLPRNEQERVERLTMWAQALGME